MFIIVKSFSYFHLIRTVVSKIICFSLPRVIRCKKLDDLAIRLGKFTHAYSGLKKMKLVVDNTMVWWWHNELILINELIVTMQLSLCSFVSCIGKRSPFDYRDIYTNSLPHVSERSFFQLIWFYATNLILCHWSHFINLIWFCPLHLILCASD